MLRDLGLLDADVAGAGQGYPRSRLLLMRRCTRSVGITPLLIGCSATDRVQRCTAWAWWTPACAVPARRTACKLVADEAVHPIRRHYTPSDRVQRDGSGAARRIGCSAARPGPVGCRRVQSQRGNPRASLSPMKRYTRSGRFNPF